MEISWVSWLQSHPLRHDYRGPGYAGISAAGLTPAKRLKFESHPLRQNYPSLLFLPFRFLQNVFRQKLSREMTK